ncbi:MAG: DoxX family protein [Bacteroidetes bacterium]|nr:DoxX family protein [Bacteroidota bacterium]
MNNILWTGQIVLAVIFLYSGINKSIYSEQQLIARGQTGVVGRGAVMIRFIGISEILGAIGVIFPWWAHILPFLTPITAGCFALIMLFAAPIHYRLKEPKNVALNLFVLAVALFVAWGRSGWQ